MKRNWLAAPIGLAATLVAALPASAQQPVENSQPDLIPVMLWTIVAVLIAMLVLSLGYLYRRTRGDPDEVIPKYVEPQPGTEAGVPAHEPEAAHGGGH